MRKFFIVLGIFTAFGVLSRSSDAGTGASNGASSATRVPTFTLDQAILMALQQNPTLLNAEQEIKRTKGVIIQVRAQALPQVNASAEFEWTDPNLVGARILGSTTGTSTTPGTATTTRAASIVDPPASQVRDPAGAALADPSPTPAGARNVQTSDIS